MSAWHDWFDLLEGYSFEVFKPEEIFSYLQKQLGKTWQE
jgi:hypothetical protein